MNSFALSLLMGAPDASGGASSGNFITTLIPFALIIGIFYFLIIRPQNKKQKETQRMLNALKKGDKVVTIGGIHGVIQSVKESSVILKVDESTKLEISRSAISTVATEGKTEKIEKNEKAEAEEKKGEGTSETRNAGAAEKSGN
ncbi:MAG: preprotein translocase subunit YajC [Spirochaetaceae bacterium]|jgi:preprotein translocase subunit YajC|nr:preprotein translocase subunit YajC [Spirochaetaceae bacterium]